MDMTSKNTFERPVGVVGAGSFGTAVANLLAKNSKVYLYARKPEVSEEMIRTGKNADQVLDKNVFPTNDLKKVGEECQVIFPVVPSANFRDMIRQLSEYIRPYHILIHGTKGLNVKGDRAKENDFRGINDDDVLTMSQLIRQESLAVRIGCLAGPNLAHELAEGQPAATVVASYFDEVIAEGQRLLRSDLFQVYGSKDLIGIELTGVLKNIIAIAAGALRGMGYGENARSLLISRGMIEMVYIGRMLGANAQAFLGLAGVGDLVATCSSNYSRNFTVGLRLANGEKLEDIEATMDETAEGVNTIRIVKNLMETKKLRAPITETLYKVINNQMTMDEALKLLMKTPFSIDVEFI
jgi:glycerol-3-phosphate dehydrogenase (NAD(P)+)